MKYVYLVRAGEGNYKVGHTSNILSRVKALQTSNSMKIEVVAAKQTPNANKLEKALHERLAKLRHNGGREWFKLSPEEAILVAIKINQSPGITISEVELLADMITEQNEKQNQMTAKMQKLLDQARAESIIPKPKIVEKYIERPNKINSDEEIFKKALEVINQRGSASTSFLQRKLSIGYGRASRIIEQLENAGHITPADGSRARQVIDSKANYISKALVNDMMTVE